MGFIIPVLLLVILFFMWFIIIKPDFGTIIESFRRVLDPSESRKLVTFLLFMASFALLSIIISGLEEFVWKASKDIFQGIPTPFDKVILPIFLFVGILLIIYKYEENERKKYKGYAKKTPTGARGLVFMLSPAPKELYTLIDEADGKKIMQEEEDVQKVLEAVQKVIEAVQNRTEFVALKDLLYKSRWGPWMVALEHHLCQSDSSKQLKYVWIIASKETELYLELVKAIIDKLRRHYTLYGNIPLLDVSTTTVDANDPVDILNKIKFCLLEAHFRHNLGPQQLVSDITGGTAVMTSGMILSTYDIGYRLQYMRQNKYNENSLLWDYQNDKPKAIEQIREEDILIEIVTDNREEKNGHD